MVREQGSGPNGKGPTAANDAVAGSRWAYAFLPYLPTIGFPLAILVGNVDSMPSLAAIATTLGSLLLAVALLDVTLRLFVRRSPCRELLLGTAVVYVMGYGYVAQPLRFLGFRQVYCFPIWCLLFLSLTILIAKSSGKCILRRVASLLQYILVSMVCLQVTWLGIALSNEGLGGKPISRLVAASNSPRPPCPQQNFRTSTTSFWTATVARTSCVIRISSTTAAFWSRCENAGSMWPTKAGPTTRKPHCRCPHR